jgi:hypothetical protein
VNKATPFKTYANALPYVLSWSVLALLMIVGMTRLPTALYTSIDGDWAKWNVEAIFHFGKVFDLSPHSMLAGMGSMYFPNLPWLNPGALALALTRTTPTPLFGNQKSVKAPPGNAAYFFIPVAMRRRGRSLWARPGLPRV